MFIYLLSVNMSATRLSALLWTETGNVWNIFNMLVIEPSLFIREPCMVFFYNVNFCVCQKGSAEKRNSIKKDLMLKCLWFCVFIWIYMIQRTACSHAQQLCLQEHSYTVDLRNSTPVSHFWISTNQIRNKHNMTMSNNGSWIHTMCKHLTALCLCLKVIFCIFH